MVRCPAALAVLALVAASSSGCGVHVFGPDCGEPPNFAGFRAAVGRPGERAEERRRDFAAHALECRSLRGLDRGAVRRRLGAPEQTGPAVSGDHTFWSYRLGPDGLGLDEEILLLEFDGDGRVVGEGIEQT